MVRVRTSKVSRFTKVAAVIFVFSLGLSNISAAHADNSGYWPDFRTLASHNEWALKAIGGDVAHQLGATGAGVKVAVLDSGIAANIPGLSEKVIAYKDFESSQPQLPEHGTMTASTIAADYDPATGVGGIAPGVSLIIGRVCYLNSCDQDAAKKAIMWATAQGAQIISMSFGGFFDPEMNALLEEVTKRGVVVVAAMGNSGCVTNPYWGLNRYCLQGTTNESSQASYPLGGLIAAGASDHFNARASFSSWGPNLDLMAPGVDNIAFDPAGVTNGFGGTSASAPLIAGSAALVLEANPSLSPAQVQAVLQATTRPALETKPKVWDRCDKSTVTNTWSCNQEVESNLPQQFFTGSGIVAADKAVILARQIAAQQTFSAPSAIVTSDTSATVSWQSSGADVYVNSKLVLKNASSPYLLSGQPNQSFAVQIARGKSFSEPALVVLHKPLVPRAPVITETFARSDLLYITTNDIEKDDSAIAWRNYGIGGLVEFSDGGFAICKGYNPNPSSTSRGIFNFTCAMNRPVGNTSGTFRLISPDSILGDKTETLNLRVTPAIKTISVTTKYLSDDSIRFDWDSVSNAQSYEYRYLPDGSTSCTTDTFLVVVGAMSQPSAFTVSAKSEPDCGGTVLMQSDYNGFRLLKHAPAKPTSIRIKEITSTYIEFDAQLADPTDTLRMYRSDGLFMRYDNPGQRIMVGIQPNEDVNGKTFTYRFMEVAHTIWGDSWSELGDPISISFKSLAAPGGSCFRWGIARSIVCNVFPNPQADGTLIEFLDADGQVLASRDTKNWTSQRFTFGKVKGAYSVRFTAAAGDVPNWYRRGDTYTTDLVSEQLIARRYSLMLPQ